MSEFLHLYPLRRCGSVSHLRSDTPGRTLPRIVEDCSEGIHSFACHSFGPTRGKRDSVLQKKNCIGLKQTHDMNFFRELGEVIKCLK